MDWGKQGPWHPAVAAPTMDVAAHPRTEDMRVFRVPPGTYGRALAPPYNGLIR